MNKSIALLLIVIILSSCFKEKTLKKETTVIENKRTNVLIEVVKKSTFQKQIISNGIVEAIQKSELSFKSDERLEYVKVKNGQRVIKGQILGILDNELLSNQLNKAKIELDKANSKLQEDKINFGLEKLDESSIEPSVLKNLLLKSGYLEAKNYLKEVQILYNQTFLKAPFNGIVADLEIKEGNSITSRDVFCKIIGERGMEVSFNVLENELFFVKVKQIIEIVSFANADKKLEGFVTEINPIVSEKGFVKIKAKIKNTNLSLFDGMRVKIFVNQPIKNVIVIPKEALVLRSNEEVVFTVENGLAKWNYVEVLSENSSSYAIKKGLKEGDSLIVSGNINLSHDAKINTTSQ